MHKRLTLLTSLLHCGGAIVLGLLLYILTRDPRPVFMQTVIPAAWKIELGWAFAPQWPSFLHSYALIIATCYLFPPRKRFHREAIFGAFLLAFTLELVQHPRIATLISVSELPVLGKLLESIKQYALFGTFDVYDLVAVICGVLAALWFSKRHSVTPADTV